MRREHEESRIGMLKHMKNLNNPESPDIPKNEVRLGLA